MLKIDKVVEPEFFAAIKRKNVPENWNGLNGSIKQKLKKHLLENEQTFNSGYVCTYCERNIRLTNSHIDHIRPKGKFPKFEFVYNNLTASCNTKNTCGNRKKGKFTENFIVPTEENPEDYFYYSADGKINAKDDNPKGSETIEFLNLNSYSLSGSRRTLFVHLSKCPKDQIEDFVETLNMFPTFIKYYQENYS
jgi:uncharacterized protein (TIGR02646 family)